MGAPKRTKADRKEFRAQVVPQEIRGLITKPGSSGHQPFLIWDVSETGIGIWASEELEQGDSVVLTIGQPFLIVVNCEVKWVEKQGDDHGYRCGLAVTDSAKKIASLYEAFIAHSEPPPAHPPGE